MEKLNVLLTGATGMVGDGVLRVLLNHPQIESVVVLGRRSCGVSHPRLTEIVHPDLYDIAAIAPKLEGLNACFFCLGTSSIGLSEEAFTKVSHTLTLHIAGHFLARNPGSTFAYISGTGTDSTAHGKVMWARVKGRTENDLAALGFRAAFGVRPGGIKPYPGQQHLPFWARVLSPLYGLVRALHADWVVTMEELANAMIESALHEPRNRALEAKDIRSLAKANQTSR